MKRTLALLAALMLLTAGLVPLAQAAPPPQALAPHGFVPLKAPPSADEGNALPAAPSPPQPARLVRSAGPAEARSAGPVKARVLEAADMPRWSALAAASPRRNTDEPHGPPNRAGAAAPFPEAGTEATLANVLVETSPGSAGNPSIAVDTSDTIYVVYQCYDSGEAGYDLCMAKSYDNGLEWHTLVIWDDALGFTGDQMQPDLVIDGSNTLWVAFRSTDPDGYFVYLTSTDGGASWTITYISTWTWYSGVYNPRIAVSGVYVYIAYEYEFSATDHDIEYSYYDGVSWYGSYVLAGSGVHERYPAIAATTYGGTTRIAIAYEYEYSATDHDVLMDCNGYLGDNYWTPNDPAVTGYDERYPDAAASGPYLYLAYQTNMYVDWDALVARSNDGGQSWADPGEWAIATSLNDTYPAITTGAGGAWVRVAAFYNGVDVAANLSTDYGNTWAGTVPLMVNPDNAVPQLHGTDIVHRPTAGAPAGRHPAVVWVDNRGGAVLNLYYSTLDEVPAISFGLAWPADGSTIQAFAPRMDWNASGYSDPDGDPVGGYWWKVWESTQAEPASWTGGSIADTRSLPWFTAPGTTYRWRVAVDDGYAMVQNGTWWSYSVGPLVGDGYEELFDGVITPPGGQWSTYTYASFESWESATFPPAGWSNTTPGWQRSSAYASLGSWSAWSTYAAPNTEYVLTSPPLDLRGSTSAYYNHDFRGSSESGYDFFSIEASATGGAPWAVLDRRSGAWNGNWWTFAEGNKDLAALGGMVGSNSGRIRLRFSTDAEVISGVGWYVDAVEVLRDAEWHSESPGYGGSSYYCSARDCRSLPYTNGVSDEFYSPILALGATPPYYLHVALRGTVPAPDTAEIWIRNAGTGGTWAQLDTLQGTELDQDAWTTFDYDISAYANQNVVVAIWNHSTYSTLLNSGDWDVDRVWIDNNPTAVKLVSFTAGPAGPAIRISWETASEHNNAGFHLYRQAGPQGQPVRLNAELIPSRSPGGDQGAAYTFLDGTARDGVAYLYTLEDVDLAGRRTPHGPTAAVAPYAAWLPSVRR